jgi:transglutaminase/protease-like cytokinesis protein 3
MKFWNSLTELWLFLVHMKKCKNLFLSIIFLSLFTNINAQTFNGDFKVVDEYVKSLGTLDTLNMGTISYLVTKKFASNTDKARAIFDWIAYNISFDTKAARNNGNEKMNSDNVLKTRKANAAGYAALFQDMCSVAKIRCLTVDGYVKNDLEQLGEKPDEFNHTWNVVQLGQSPDSWYYVDPAWGSGYTDEKLNTFTKAYNDAFFFADKRIFNYQHFPDNGAWLLGTGVKSGKDFFAMPIVKNHAYDFGISNFSPSTGLIKANLNKPVRFSFKVGNQAAVDTVNLLIGVEKNKKLQTVYFSYNNSVVSFTHKFEEEDSYPVTVLINNKPVLAYMIEVTE